jgi:hypothetical protein
MDTVKIAESVQDDWGEVVWSIIDEAARRFAACGRADDFCLQCVSGVNLVFGGTNRVIWSAASGFRCDQSYCSEGFLSEWSRLYG